MTQSFQEIEKKFAELEVRFEEIEGLNELFARQAKEYFLLFNTTRKLNASNGIKHFYKTLDNIFKKNFKVDEYALILRNPNSDILSVNHSMGLSKRILKEIFYRPNEGMVGKVYEKKRAVYIPDISAIKGFTYYYSRKKIKGSLYYLPVLKKNNECYGVLKLRKYSKDSFSEIERAVLPHLQSEIGISLLSAQNMDLLNSNSYLDDVTHLYNKQYYDSHFIVEFKRAQRYQHHLSLILIDIDNFKELNRKFGHNEGNEFLKNTGKLLQKYTRSSDICIRYQEDEFLIMLPETSKQAAYEVAIKLKKQIEEFSFTEDGTMIDYNVTLSLGISSYPLDTIEPKLLFNLAKKSLNDAKKDGKNKIGYTSPLPSQNV